MQRYLYAYKNNVGIRLVLIFFFAQICLYVCVRRGQGEESRVNSKTRKSQIAQKNRLVSAQIA